MARITLFSLVGLALLFGCKIMRIGRAVTLPDPFAVNETNPLSQNGYRKTTGLTPVKFTPNPAQKTLILFIQGQSIWTNLLQNLYVPSTNVLQLNIYDGAFYQISDKMLGNTDEGPSWGSGNIAARLGDLFVTNGIFDKVVIMNFAYGGTSIVDWSSSGTLFDRMPVAMERLAQNGITAATTGVTFAFLHGQGETDNLAGMSQATFQSNLVSILSRLSGIGFIGRKFIPLETWYNGVPSTPIRAAQAAVVDGVTIFQGGDLDTLDNTHRRDGTHFYADADAAAVATIVYNAMHATGTPF